MMPSFSSAIDCQPVQECLAAAKTVREEFADSWAASIDELANLRDNLEAWQRELSEEHVQLQQERSQLEQERVDLHRMQEERAEQSDDMHHQCEALETELEIVRARAVEMSTTLAEERLQMKESREEWGNELKQLRQHFEQQVNQEQASDATAAPRFIAESAQVTAKAPSDVVVGSVLAQFDKIRQQRVHRRERSE